MLLGRRREPLQATAAEARSRGGQAEWREADVSRDEEVHAAVAATPERLGALDTLGQVAGGSCAQACGTPAPGCP